MKSTYLGGRCAPPTTKSTYAAFHDLCSVDQHGASTFLWHYPHFFERAIGPRVLARKARIFYRTANWERAFAVQSSSSGKIRHDSQQSEAMQTCSLISLGYVDSLGFWHGFSNTGLGTPWAIMTLAIIGLGDCGLVRRFYLGDFD
jgi:hypothetical protein